MHIRNSPKQSAKKYCRPSVQYRHGLTWLPQKIVLCLFAFKLLLFAYAASEMGAGVGCGITCVRRLGGNDEDFKAPTIWEALESLPMHVLYGVCSLFVMHGAAWLVIVAMVVEKKRAGKATTLDAAILAGLTMHVSDIVLDFIMMAKFWAMGLIVFLTCSMVFVSLPALMNFAMHAVQFATTSDKEIINDVLPEMLGGRTKTALLADFVLNLLLVRIFFDAWRSVANDKKTLSLSLTKGMESLFESFPSSAMTLYAALCCLHAQGADRAILICSVTMGLCSIAYACLDADWEAFECVENKFRMRVWRFSFRLSELSTRLFSVVVFGYAVRPEKLSIHQQAPPWILGFLAADFAGTFLLAFIYSEMLDRNTTKERGKLFTAFFTTLPQMIAGPPPSNFAARFCLRFYVYRLVLTVAILLVSVAQIFQSTAKTQFMHGHLEYPAILLGMFSLFASTILVEAVRSWNDVQCDMRLPEVGDQVTTSVVCEVMPDADGNDDAWVLKPGEIATVVELINDELFTLQHSSGLISQCTYLKYFIYATNQNARNYNQLSQ